MSMPSLEPEETPLAPDELGLAGLSPNPLPPEESVELETVNPAAIEGPGTALEPAGDGWALIALVPYDGHEPPASVSEELAQGVWFTEPEDPKLVFDEDPAKVWDDAMARRTFPL